MFIPVSPYQIPDTTALFVPSIIICYSNSSPGKVKGKAAPLLAWTGPEGSRRMRLPDFKTLGT
jgi:hypothetical protein